MKQKSSRTLQAGLLGLFCLAAVGMVIGMQARSKQETEGTEVKNGLQKVALQTAAPKPPLKMNGPLTTKTAAGPAWAKNQPIYEVNWDVYGFKKGAAFRGFEKRLPVLKDLGVGIIWLMPIYPRGYLKGFGSPYAVRDYTNVNPDLGTKAEFKHLIDSAHKLGLHIILDWVPNHTSWDNAMITSHPEFYEKNAKGEIVQASVWADVAQLNYGKAGQPNQLLWNTMRDNMQYWIRTFNIDGFRCDVAGSNGKVPLAFWTWLRPQLETIKPLFMLAESDNVELHPVFDMTYSWNLPPTMWGVCAGRQPATDIDGALGWEAEHFPAGSVRMRFLDNHDWHPHADWDWGKNPVVDTSKGLPQVAPMMVLCTTVPGKPLLYNGQEMSFLKVNPPANADDARKSPVWPFYRRLMQLYQTQPAINTGSFTRIVSNHDDKVYAFVRQSGQTRVLVVVNLSDKVQRTTLSGASLAGSYREWFTNRDVKMAASPALNLAPWAYQVYVGSTK